MAKIAMIAEIAKIVETEIVRFLKTFKVWVFFEKLDGFFEKETWILSNFAKGDKFAEEYDFLKFFSLK